MRGEESPGPATREEKERGLGMPPPPLSDHPEALNSLGAQPQDANPTNNLQEPH